MTDASDVITYIGVPLAVLGVLPIFYTFINSFFTLRNVRRSLRKCGLEATTRGSFMAGVVEVSLPRFSITPLDRSEEGYWTQTLKPSTLRGGTWTTFYWNQLITGHAQQRIQYSSDLRVPQAEIELEELLGFLLDRGAVPDVKGIHMLRVSGLWTPTGTCLMLSPDTSQCVLRVSVSDDSDGVLSLALQWNPKWDVREAKSLPPGWIRFELPQASSDSKTKPHEADDGAPRTDEEDQKVVLERQDMAPPDNDSSFSNEQTHELKPPSYQPSPTSLRFNLSSHFSAPHLTINSPSYEYLQAPISTSLEPLSPPSNSWFAPLSLAFALSQHLPLYTHQIPPFLHNLPTQIPAGVLVMLGLVSVEDVPEWETQYDPNERNIAFQQR